MAENAMFAPSGHTLGSRPIAPVRVQALIASRILLKTYSSGETVPLGKPIGLLPMYPYPTRPATKVGRMGRLSRFDRSETYVGDARIWSISLQMSAGSTIPFCNEYAITASIRIRRTLPIDTEPSIRAARTLTHSRPQASLYFLATRRA